MDNSEIDVAENKREEPMEVVRVRALHAELLKMISELRKDPRTPKSFKGMLKES